MMYRLALACCFLMLLTTFSNAQEEPVYIFEIPDPDAATVLEAAAIDHLNLSVSESYLLERHTDYIRLNEFERRRLRQEYLAEVSSEIEKRKKAARAKTAYTFSGTLSVGEYDFQNKTFPFLRFYRGLSGAGGRVSIERGEIKGMNWSYAPTAGIDPRGVPLGFALERNRHAVRYTFDWHPVRTSLLVDDPSEAEKFLETFGRRMDATIVTSLVDISSETQGGRAVSYRFSVECMVMTAVVDDVFYSRVMSVNGEPSEKCDQYLFWRSNGVEPPELFEGIMKDFEG